MTFRPPTLREYLILKFSGDPTEVIDTVGNISNGSVRTLGEVKQFLTEYLSNVENIRQSNENMRIPYYPYGEKQEQYFNCGTSDIKVVSDYTRLNFSDILNLEIFVFWEYLHDAFVWNCSRTKSGREYLENAWYYQQTEPDRKALRKKFGG